MKHKWTKEQHAKFRRTMEERRRIEEAARNGNVARKIHATITRNQRKTEEMWTYWAAKLVRALPDEKLAQLVTFKEIIQ